MDVKLSLSGYKEIDDVLKGLPLQLTHRILGQAHADAAKPIIPAAQSKIKNRRGYLSKSIGTEKISMRKADTVGLVYVGPRRKRGYKGYAGHLVEFGHRITNRKGGPTLGYVKPYPFMEPAFNSTKSQVTDNIKESVGKKLRNFMRTTIRKAGGTWSK
jgi:HK97 gp10 family phage protein